MLVCQELYVCENFILLALNIENYNSRNKDKYTNIFGELDIFLKEIHHIVSACMAIRG